MQFVWMYWEGSAKGNELLYSMRSVEKNFLGNAEIILIGDKPVWYKGTHFPATRIPEGYRQQFRDYYSKVLKAAFSDEIDENFVAMMDDIYFTGKVTPEEVMTSWHCGRHLRENIRNAGRAKNAWKRGVQEALKIVDKEVMYNYATHLPQYYNSSNLIKMEVEHGLLSDYHNFETIYGNAFRSNPKPCSRFMHRVRRARSVDNWRALKVRKVLNHLSRVWNDDLELYLNEKFPEQGSFEIDGSKVKTFNHPPVKKTEGGPPLTFVWPYITSKLSGEELQLSIESVKRFYQGEVKTLVIGDCPDWHTGMHIPKPRIKASPHTSFRDVFSKLMVANTTQLTGKRYVWMMDDIYFTRPVTYQQLSVPRYSSVRTVQELEAWSPSNKWLNLKKKTMLKIAEKNGKCFDYATHLPHLVVKQTLNKALRDFGVDLQADMHLWEIIYGNYRKDVEPQDCSPFFFRTTRAINDIEAYRKKKAFVFNNGNHGWCDELRDFLHERIYGENVIEVPQVAGESKSYAVIPYTKRDAARERNLKFVKQWAEKNFDEVLVCESSPEEVFNKCKLVNEGIDSLDANPDDVICILDGDVVISPHMLDKAVSKARDHKGLVYPFNSIRRLCPNDTRYFVRSNGKRIDDFTGKPGNFSCIKKRHNCPGTILLLSKRSWDESGGMDTRFTEWGYEDTAFRNSCRAKLGPEYRFEHTAVHLHHPVNGRRGVGNKKLFMRQYA